MLTKSQRSNVCMAPSLKLLGLPSGCQLCHSCVCLELFLWSHHASHGTDRGESASEANEIRGLDGALRDDWHMQSVPIVAHSCSGLRKGGGVLQPEEAPAGVQARE